MSREQRIRDLTDDIFSFAEMRGHKDPEEIATALALVLARVIHGCWANEHHKGVPDHYADVMHEYNRRVCEIQQRGFTQ